MLFTMSPGLVARPLGMFSQAGTTPTRLIGRSSVATALNVPSTLAAPLMSNFISSIAGGGFSEMPPVSNVTPLPISAVGASPRAPPLYSRTIRYAGSSVPLVTDRNEPICRRRHSASFSTRTRILRCSRASVARRFREIAGRADVRRLVGEVAHQAHAGEDALAVLDGALGIAALAASGDRDAELGQRRLLPLVRRSCGRECGTASSHATSTAMRVIAYVSASPTPSRPR